MTTDQVLAASGAVALVLFGQWIRKHFTHRQSEASLKADNLALKTHVTSLTAKLDEANAQLQQNNHAAEIKVLAIQAKYDERFGREAILAKHRFEEPNGTYFDHVNKVHVCPFCIQQPLQVVSSMQDYGHGWYCPSHLAFLTQSPRVCPVYT